MITTIKMEFPTLQTKQPLAQCLRGAICSIDPGNPLLCQKDKEGSFLFRYPRIHYRWKTPHTGILVGFLDGAEYLLNLPLAGKTLMLGTEQVPVTCAQIMTSPLVFSESDTLRRYQLNSPWLPFSQQAYARFNCQRQDQRQETLDRLARNHIVSAMRDLELPPTWHIQAAMDVSQMRFVKYKDINVWGVWGSLLCNVNLPQGFALGRKLSYGYGSFL